LGYFRALSELPHANLKIDFLILKFLLAPFPFPAIRRPVQLFVLNDRFPVDLVTFAVKILCGLAVASGLPPNPVLEVDPIALLRRLHQF
jgi:hypothetical protein